MDMSVFEEILEVVASGVAGRGVTSLCSHINFEDALGLLEGAKRVAIVTGFYIPGAGAPETDGPGGSVALGRALVRRGADVAIFTDNLCYDVVKACSDSVGGPEVKCADGPDGVISWSPDLIIYLERVGKASDGNYYNMRSVKINDTVVALDDAVSIARNSGIAVMAVGDGGNEAGMGYFYSRLSELLPDYSPCLSVVESDLALAVDVSDWGGYALAGLLSINACKWLGVSPDEVETMLLAQVDSGAVDGVTLEGKPGVDGFPLKVQRSVAGNIKSLIDRELDF